MKAQITLLSQKICFELNMVFIAVAVFVVMSILIMTILKRYIRCPSDKLLVIYGKTGDDESNATIIHGGAAFVWPIIQAYEFLSLKPHMGKVDSLFARSAEDSRVDLGFEFTTGISTEEKSAMNAAERLLGWPESQIAMLAKDIVIGQMRLAIAMTKDRDFLDLEKLLTLFVAGVEIELDKVGLKLININVLDLKIDGKRI